MKTLMIMLTNVDTGEVLKTKVIENPPFKRVEQLSKDWLNCFLRGVSIPIDKGLFELRITYCDVKLTIQHKQLQIF